MLLEYLIEIILKTFEKIIAIYLGNFNKTCQSKNLNLLEMIKMANFTGNLQ
jgi:hypothetical protein